MFIILGVIALVAVVVIAIVGVGLLRDDDTEPTTTTEDTELADARQDLRSALEDDDRDEVSSIIDDNPDLLDDATDAPRGETTSIALDDEEGLGFGTVPATFSEGFRAGAEPDDVGGLVLAPGGEVLGALGEVVDPVDDGDHPVVLFSDDGDGGDVDLVVNRVTTELLFVDDEVDGSIETAGDLARYEVDLDEGAAYTVELEGDGATATVSDPDGTEVDTSDADTGQGLEALTDGTYVVEVTGRDDAAPTFTLSVVLVPDFTITNLFDDAPATSPFFYEYKTPEEADTLFGQFRVAVSGGVTIRVTSTPEAGGDVQLSVRRPGQPDQTFNDAPPGQPESYEITVDGPTPIEFQSEIINSVPDRTTITVETV